LRYVRGYGDLWTISEDIFVFGATQEDSKKASSSFTKKKYFLAHPIQSPRILYKETYKTQGFLDYLILYKFFDALTLQSHAAGC